MLREFILFHNYVYIMNVDTTNYTILTYLTKNPESNKIDRSLFHDLSIVTYVNRGGQKHVRKIK